MPGASPDQQYLARPDGREVGIECPSVAYYNAAIGGGAPGTDADECYSRARRKNLVGVFPCPLAKRKCGFGAWLSATTISSWFNARKTR